MSWCSVFLACWRCTEWCIRAVREKWSVLVFCFLGVLAMHCVVYTSCQREVECLGVLFSWRVGDALSGVYKLSERSGVSRCSVFLPCWRCTEWCIQAVREKWSVLVFCFLGVLAMHCVVYTSCQREVECLGVLFSWRVGDALSGLYKLSERSRVSRCSVFLPCWRCTVWCIRAVREKWSVSVFCFLGVLAMH